MKNSPLTPLLLDDSTSTIQGHGPKTAHLTTVHFSIEFLTGSPDSLILQAIVGLLFNARPTATGKISPSLVCWALPNLSHPSL